MTHILPRISTPEQTRERHEVAFLGEETGGALSLRSQSIAPAQGTPLHKHVEQDETFHLFSGALRFVVGDEVLFAVAGTSLFVPRDTPHSLLNIGETDALLISVLTPGIHDGFVLNVPKAEREGASREMLNDMAEQYGAVILDGKQSHLK